MKKPVITVFTPTYNRAYLLPRLYESLCRQTCTAFVWLIVDDGSTDNTKDLVRKWQEDSLVDIVYIYQENQGMHGAHNTAYENCYTEYNVCIDSDDYMPDNAIERILFHIGHMPSDLAGIVGLDADKNTLRVIGTEIPRELTRVKLNELYSSYEVRGDKKLVLKTDIVRRYPKYPLYSNERFVPLDYLYLMINRDYDFMPVNEVFCIVEYQQDGSTMNILRQYQKSPNGFAFSRVSRINYENTFRERFKNAIHLVSSAIFAKDFKWIFKSNHTLLVLLAIPFGILLNFYIRVKIKK
ncbi:glycosyltransferase family 2 protein [Riemerella anatipestifer]|uniref:glycosyltransferase family 2 protein n=1 Tax=Riemerella anatipestifer TaxID=34085 RepID=UPI002A863848|nr:glycosyltransferase family 2 protein [Riemerella anatipestifer]